jgi:hypothetical protein
VFVSKAGRKPSELSPIRVESHQEILSGNLQPKSLKIENTLAYYNTAIISAVKSVEVHGLNREQSF